MHCATLRRPRFDRARGLRKMRPGPGANPTGASAPAGVRLPVSRPGWSAGRPGRPSARSWPSRARRGARGPLGPRPIRTSSRRSASPRASHCSGVAPRNGVLLPGGWLRTSSVRPRPLRLAPTTTPRGRPRPPSARPPPPVFAPQSDDRHLLPPEPPPPSTRGQAGAARGSMARHRSGAGRRRAPGSVPKRPQPAPPGAGPSSRRSERQAPQAGRAMTVLPRAAGVTSGSIGGPRAVLPRS